MLATGFVLRDFAGAIGAPATAGGEGDVEKDTRQSVVSVSEPSLLG